MQFLTAVRTINPTVKPISVDELKHQTRISFNDDDDTISRYIDAATDHLERILGRAIINQTWKVEADQFCSTIRLPRGAVSSVVSVKYYDGGNVQQTASASLYGLFTDSLGPFIELKPSQSWPATYSRRDAVEITWVCGYGATADAVPQGLRQTIALLASEMYEHRQSTAQGGWDELPYGVRAMCSPYRVMHV